ncbi:unnamed protein product [Ectocarpus sp. 12 AP-2014]
MAAFNPTWTPGYDQSGRFCWYNKATGRVHHLSPLDSVDRCQQKQQQQRRRQGQGLSMAPDEDAGLLCDVAHPNVPTGSYFSLPATEVAEREEAGAFTQREKRGFAWDRGTRDETSTQPPTCRMYKPFAEHKKPVALESMKPRRPHPAYKPSQRAWAKPVSETPVSRGRPGFDKSMPPPLPRPARGRPPLSQRGGRRMPGPPAFPETHHRCRVGNARVESPHRQAVDLWGEFHMSV